MSRLVVFAILIVTAATAAPVPKALRRPPARVGEWRVEFANGVTEACSIGRDDTAAVVEPLRRSAGRVEVEAGGVLVVKFADDRTERWTPVADGYTVEHWYPSAVYLQTMPVRGTATRK